MEESAISITSIDFGGENARQSLRRELGITSFGINLLRLRPRERFRVHRHELQEEAYIVLEGELTLIVEGESHVLSRGMAARVAPSAKRQLTNPSPEPVLLLALGGHGEHQTRDAIAWLSWDDTGAGRPPAEVPLPEDLPSDGA